MTEEEKGVPKEARDFKTPETESATEETGDTPPETEEQTKIRELQEQLQSLLAQQEEINNRIKETQEQIKDQEQVAELKEKLKLDHGEMNLDIGNFYGGNFREVYFDMDEDGKVVGVLKQQKTDIFNKPKPGKFTEDEITTSVAGDPVWAQREVAPLQEILGKDLIGVAPEYEDQFEVSISIDKLNEAIRSGKVVIDRDEEGDFDFQVPELEE